MGHLGEMPVSSWVRDTQERDFAERQRISGGKASLLGREQGHLIRGASMARRRRVLNEPGQGYWPCPRSAGGSEAGGELRFPRSFIHLATPCPQPTEVHLPVAQRQNVFSAKRQQHPWQPDHPWAPRIVALCPGPWLPSLFFAEILVATRNRNNSQPSCEPGPQGEHQQVALPEWGS